MNDERPDSAQPNLVGTLLSLRFESEDGQFSVGVVESERAHVTVVGNLRGAVPGERVQAVGRWESHARYGRQFRAESCVVLPPATREGIVRYLGSGLIEGIGPVLAERLVEAFGEQTLEVIAQHPERLVEVPGIGRVRSERILAAWEKQAAVREVMFFLTAHGVSPTFAHRIYQAYGNQAVEVVQRHPYRLARDVFGIGFKSADRIAHAMGIEADDPERLAAGLAWTLEEAGGHGHVLLPRPLLLERAAAVLEVDTNRLSTCLDEVCTQGSLVEEASPFVVGSGPPVVYTRAAFGTEVALAERVTRLARRSVPEDRARRLLAAAQDRERGLGIRLERGQRRAVNELVGAQLGILTGGPGTGKTTIVRLFAEAVETVGGRVALAAPTGRAARRLSESTGRPAETLHRLLEFNFSERRFERDAERPVEADLVVVDEASMLDQSLARALFRAVAETTSVLLVGDADQLPSVGPGNVLHDLLSHSGIRSHRLTEVFRQAADSHIVRSAHRIRRGQIPSRGRRGRDGRLGDFFHIAVDDATGTRETVIELVSRRIPSAFGLDPLADIQVLAPMHRGEAGIAALNRSLQAALNPTGEPIPVGDRELRQGDKVIQLRNNYQREVFNGEIGRILGVDPVSGQVRVGFDGRDVSYPATELHELAPAYCISIHKSQGSEFPAVVVALVRQHYLLLQRNLIYTAVTRGRRLVCIVGEPKALVRAIRNASPAQRYTGLEGRLGELLAASS
jgi:exodeoxyribonuclease V alpha subunit